jgi:hypothetical protein
VKRLRDLLDAWRSLGDRTRMTLGAVVILAVIGGLAGGAVAWGDWRGRVVPPRVRRARRHRV